LMVGKMGGEAPTARDRLRSYEDNTLKTKLLGPAV
jgi:hypothetical protein